MNYVVIRLTGQDVKEDTSKKKDVKEENNLELVKTPHEVSDYKA